MITSDTFVKLKNSKVNSKYVTIFERFITRRKYTEALKLSRGKPDLDYVFGCLKQKKQTLKVECSSHQIIVIINKEHHLNGFHF